MNDLLETLQIGTMNSGHALEINFYMTGTN